MGRTLSLLTVVVLTATVSLASEDWLQDLPLGLDADLIVVPEDNPMTAEKAELGKLLYFDPRLSADGTVSCATCHDPQRGFTDQRPVSTGVAGKQGTRNAPTVINTVFGSAQFWDGRAATLEEQALEPIVNPVEMAHTMEAAVESIGSIEAYTPWFEAAFGDAGVTADRIARAIASYERTVVSGNSEWDRYAYLGEEDALHESARRGLALFEGKANCSRCHLGFNLTDDLFHNIGVGMGADEPDLGRYLVTGVEKDKGAFKTPTLRDVSRTAPYMHDGSVATLEDVIDLYLRGGEANEWLDPNMERLDLTAQEAVDLLAFLLSLDGDWEPTPVPDLPGLAQ